MRTRVIHSPKIALRAALTATACGLVLALAAAPASAAPGTNDRPAAGAFGGEHEFDGRIKLRFKRDHAIGLHLARYSVKGTLRCGDDEDYPLDFGGMVTARTAARVRGDRSFRLNTAFLRVRGRYVSAQRVTGTLKVTTMMGCSRTGSFSARRGG